MCLTYINCFTSYLFQIYSHTLNVTHEAILRRYLNLNYFTCKLFTKLHFFYSHLAFYPISGTFIILCTTKWDPIDYTSVYVMFCIGLKMAE
jgi:hypothetical protein